MSQERELLLYKQNLHSIHERWQAAAHQAEIIDAIFGKKKCKRVFIRGGRKSSKTETALYLANRMSICGPNRVSSVIGPSLKQQRKIVWNNRRLQEFAPRSWGGIVREAESMVRFPNGSFIEVDGSENSEAHRGEEQDLLILDELKDHQFDSYNAMYPNLLARDGVLVVMGTPPMHKKNIYYELEQAAQEDPRWAFFHWRCWDNPNISHVWLEEEKSAYYRRGDGHIWESEYEAKYVFGGKRAVFSVFDEERNILTHDAMLATLEKDKHHLDYFIVTDPGNRVCHATLFIAYDRTNNYIWILDELYVTEQADTATGRVFPRILEKASELFPPRVVPWYVYDEAALWYETEVSAQFPDSPPLSPTNKSIRDKETSMGVIKDCMAAGKYVQSDRCEELKGEIEAYYIDENGRYPKVDDHAIDCLRYFFDFVGYSYQLTPKTDAIIAHEAVKKRSDDWANVSDDILLDDEDFLWN